MIAVIMSVYKNDKLDYLKESLNSLYCQTFKEFDILIQCDGKLSSELENYLDEEFSMKRINYLNKRNENKGLAFSLNELISINYDKYTYFIRMDADDISVPTRIEKQYTIMEACKNIDICGGLIEEFNIDTGNTQIIQYPENSNNILNGMKKRNSMAHVTVCIRKSFFIKAGIYDPSKMNEDLDLWLRGFENECKFYNLQDILVKVRTNEAFFQRRKNYKRAIEVMKLKMKASKIFHFGTSGYLFAFAHMLLFLLPSKLKKFIYTKFRD